MRTGAAATAAAPTSIQPTPMVDDVCSTCLVTPMARVEAAGPAYVVPSAARPMMVVMVGTSTGVGAHAVCSPHQPRVPRS
mmetsp:Transcript_84764/g.177284  ORF Transcript_84764/g.177284 Transcript_84764/m.177284 type:complete len:80 (-) Transcript_84764:219-458(-)|eukprot:CAMPEP_0206424576 /NCGR_PEP_ID=MMETSP0324_2-20121206/3308_1 /ASSEMBLY_ACC=CAM_ASM_000836 /TAXON_ID=2866 /ORGANISM="Crypthecodinium cohnii, Strain Seligo" /LENGTH=79 /DNA_ID=CAMNT_0053889253 /DNA_START=279 /DNA_END=518 /DNA_ORIENTATION=+